MYIVPRAAYESDARRRARARAHMRVVRGRVAEFEFRGIATRLVTSILSGAPLSGRRVR